MPPEEAAWYKLTDQELPEEGRKKLPGHLAVAMQVAMDDFLPWSAPVSAAATPDEICMNQRQSWDVHFRASAVDDRVILVAVELAPGACRRGPVPLDLGATYAVNADAGQILAVRTAIGRVIPRALEEGKAQPYFPDRLNLREFERLDGNMAAAIQLALDDFRPRGAKPSPGINPEDTCLQERRAYDATAAPAPDAIMLVRFDVNEACPPSGPPAVIDGVEHLPPVEAPIYAVDLRTMRILTFAFHPRPRPTKN